MMMIVFGNEDLCSGDFYLATSLADLTVGSESESGRAGALVGGRSVGVVAPFGIWNCQEDSTEDCLDTCVSSLSWHSGQPWLKH